MESSRYAWSPQLSPQTDAIRAAPICEELFFGGAAGGGKSDFLLGDFLQDVEQGRVWAGILFRKTYPELDEIIERSQAIYPHTGAEYLVGQKVWRWPNGALLRLRHIDNPNDFQAYMGHSYAWIAFDELPTWDSLKPYNMMKSRLRGPARYKRMRSTGNPGGKCHLEIKDYFDIATHPDGYHPIKDSVSGMTRMFIPSKVTDNRILLDNDPGYVDRLKGVGDPELVAAWLDGSWDAVVGSYFSMLRRVDVEVDPFEIPPDWAVFSCGDYGEHNPTWWGLIAVNPDDDVYVIDEYHRSDTGGAEHARGVKSLLDGCPYIPGQRPRLNLAPSDMWTKRRPGEANQALAPSDSFAQEGIHLTRANMDRVNGWRNLKDLLYAKRLKFFKGRTDHVCASLTSVQRDPNNPEDVLKGGDDHAADGLRLGVNHVYKPRKIPQEIIDDNRFTGQHLLDLLKEREQKVVERY